MRDGGEFASDARRDDAIATRSRVRHGRRIGVVAGDANANAANANAANASAAFRDAFIIRQACITKSSHTRLSFIFVRFVRASSVRYAIAMDARENASAALDARAECDAALATNARLEHDVEDARDALGKAKEEFERRERALSEALAMRDQTIRELENKGERRRARRTRWINRRRAVREGQVTNKIMKENEEALKNALDVRTGEVDALLRDRVRAPMRENEMGDDVASRVLAMKRRTLAYESQIAAMKREMEAVHRDMTRVRENMTHVEVILAGKDDANAKQAERLRQMETELASGVDAMRDFASREAKRANEITLLRKALDASRAQTRRLEAELDVIDHAARMK